MKIRLASFVALLFCPHVFAVTVDQLVSREHSDMNVVGDRFAVGRDGLVYVTNVKGYILRMKPDGSDKQGFKARWAISGVAANASGVIATSNAHLSRFVQLWSPTFQEIAFVRDFFSNDAVTYSSPSDVQTGPSGDFFAPDHLRDNGRILRINPAGNIIATYPLEKFGDPLKGTALRIRVVEPLKRFYAFTVAGNVHAMDFEGKVLWKLDKVLGPAHFGHSFSGDCDADDEGNLYVLKAGSHVVEIFAPDGRPSGKVTLSAKNFGPQVLLRVWKNEMFVKHDDATELFQVYDRQTGAFLRAIHADVEKFSMTYPTDVWVAGQPVPFALALLANGKTKTPEWPVRIAPLNDPEWTTLPVENGNVTPPAEARGLYHLQAGAGAYKIESLIEIRAPDSKGTINIFTPLNRIYYGRGEKIPAKILVRTNAAEIPQVLPWKVTDSAGNVVAQGTTPLADKAGEVVLPPEITAKFRPGRYILSGEAPGFTVAPQYLRIGPGLNERPAYHVVQHEDFNFPEPRVEYFDVPEMTLAYVSRQKTLGVNMAASHLAWKNGLGRQFDQTLNDEPLLKRLRADPNGVAPEKAQVESYANQVVASFGAEGIEQQGILLAMDAGLPLGTLFDGRKPEQIKQALEDVTLRLESYPAFRGWSWAGNWWLDPKAKFADDQARKDWNEAMKAALESGKWDPSLETRSDAWVKLAGEAQTFLDGALQKASPGKISAMTGPYRQPGILPQIAFRDTDEVDLAYQAENFQSPQMAPHAVDFYRRPGKPVWGHPEVHNDDGSGRHLLPLALQMIMRGADGTGWQAPHPAGSTTYLDGDFADDPRSTGRGYASMMRALGGALRQYGPWLSTLKTEDPIAIVVSTRMMRLDEQFHKIGGKYFDQLYEAYNACLYAHRPATYVFGEDLKPGALKTFKAVLVVGQKVELDPPLLAALEDAKGAGVPVFHDETCHPEAVKGFTPLKIAFDKISKDISGGWQDDSGNYRIPRIFAEEAAQLAEAFGPAVPPIAQVENPELMLTELRNGQGRFFWVVNNDVPDFDPGQMWRMSLFITQRVPQSAPVGLEAKGKVVYELFAMKNMPADAKGAVPADLSTVPARLFAVLPKPIKSVSLTAPKDVKAGEKFSWKTSIDGPAMTYPLRLRLLDGSGAVIQEYFPRTAEGFLVVPVNAGAEVTLEAKELISGQSATRKIAVAGGMEGKSGGASLAQDENVGRHFGPHLRDIAVSEDGTTALLNAMNWNDNTYLIDVATGKARTQGRIGHYFTHDPTAVATGFAIRGFDLNTAEAYHLYLLGPDGAPRRRFALYGLPKRGTGWWSAAWLSDRIDNFAVSPDGSWVAAAGDLGLAVWSSDGKLLWSDDWWKTKRQRVMLLAQDGKTLVSMTGMEVLARNASDGKLLWQLKLADAGKIQSGVVSTDGKTLAFRATTEGGRVFLVRDGKLITTLVANANELSLTPDGSDVLVIQNNTLRCYAKNGSLLWSFKADEQLHELRVTPDGKRVAVGSQLGTLYVFDKTGNLLLNRDCGALPVPAWLPDGDLLVATWTGNVMRLASNGTEKWLVHLQPKGPALQNMPVPVDQTPTARMTGWGNAAAEPGALSGNLLAENKARINATYNGLHPQPWQNSIELLRDGDSSPPPKEWLPWKTVQYIDSGWVDKLAVEFDMSPVKSCVTGITFVEDPAHPESWMRDVRLQWWEPKAGEWKDGPYLLSNQATHTHKFDSPVESTKFRLVSTGGGTWPISNLRLGEIVFHGESIEELPAPAGKQ